MMDAVLKECECPVCLSLFRKPIRISPCGHNYCHNCAEILCRDKQTIRCPICRQKIEPTKNGIHEWTQNYALENLLEIFQTNTLSKIDRQSKKAGNLGTNGLSHFEEATRLISNEKRCYDSAAHFLLASRQEKEWSRLHLIGLAIECYATNGKIAAATECVLEIENILRSRDCLHAPKEVKKACDIEVEHIVYTLVQFKLFDDALILNYARVTFVATFECEMKLETLEKVGRAMQSLARHVSNNNQQATRFSTKYCSVMDDVIEEMEKAHGSCHKQKTKLLCKVMKYYGFCCNKMNNCKKSVLIHKKAIFLLESVFGSYANQMKLLGYCCNNLGSAYEGLHDIELAKRLYKKALKIYHLADDWSTVNEKSTSIYPAQDNLSRVCRMCGA